MIVTGGHPGDPEYGCGGTVARYADRGTKWCFYTSTMATRRTNRPQGCAGRRSRREKLAPFSKRGPLYAGQIDGRAVVDNAHYDAFRQILEERRPDVMFTHWPIDNHADHRAISLLVYDAWVRLGRRFAFYYYEVSNGEDTVQFAPTHYVDITGVVSRKRDACYAHATQAPDKYYPSRNS